MNKALVISETPNSMPTRTHVQRDPHDLGATFNAMRERQRLHAETVRRMNEAMANTSSLQGLGAYAQQDACRNQQDVNQSVGFWPFS